MGEIKVPDRDFDRFPGTARDEASGTPSETFDALWGYSSNSWVRPRQRPCCGGAQGGGWEISRNSQSLQSGARTLNTPTPFRLIGSTQTNSRTPHFKPSYKISAACYWS